MASQTALIKKIALPNGVLLALTTIVISVIIYVMGMTYEQPWWQSLLNFAAMLWFVIYGIKAYKKDNSGYLSLAEALKTGLAITLIAGVIGSIFMYLFTTIIEPDFVMNMLEAARVKRIEDNPEMAQEQIDMAMAISEKMISPGILTAISIITSLFFGFIISLIAGLVLKNNRPE